MDKIAVTEAPPETDYAFDAEQVAVIVLNQYELEELSEHTPLVFTIATTYEQVNFLRRNVN